MELERRKNAPFKMAARLPTRDTELRHMRTCASAPDMEREMILLYKQHVGSAFWCTTSHICETVKLFEGCSLTRIHSILKFNILYYRFLFNCTLHLAKQYLSGGYHDSRGWALFGGFTSRVEHMSPHMRKRRG